MKFFNTQEDVLDIQLTQEGKRRLAGGKFKPQYYAFFDSDVLYDISYTGDDEAQNQSVPRIISETPRLRVQYQREGVESNFKKLKKLRRTGKKINNESMDRSFQQMPLGTSTGNDYLPAWRINLAEGQIHDVVSTHSASWGVSFIPQLSSSVTVKTRVEFDEEMASDDPASETESISTGGRPIFNPEGTGEVGEQPQIYPDGTYLVTEQGSLLLDFAELNNIFDDENFDIEVFEIMTEGAGSETKEILRPLKFLTEESYSKKSDREISYEVKHPDTGHVGHYIVINVDGELDVDDLGKFSGRKKGVGAATSPYGNGDLSDFDPDDLKEPC
mgnify:CR=1 FL=1